MPREFNLRDFFFYCTNRWVYFVLAVALGVLCSVGIYGYETIQERDKVVIESSVVLCEIEMYTTAFASNSADSSTLSEGYFDSLKRATDTMVSQANDALFVKDAQNRAVVYALDEGLMACTNLELSTFLQNSLEVTAHGYWVNVRFSYGARKSGYREGSATALVNAYTSFLAASVSGNVDSFGAMQQMYLDGVLDRPPMRLTEASKIERVVASQPIVKPLVMGAFLGLLLVGLVVFATFLLDPKMKSASELLEAGFPILVEVDANEFSEDKLARAVASLDKAQCVCLVQAGGKGAASFAGALAQYMGRAGNRVLLIDGTKKNGRFRDFIAGDDAALKRDGNADTAEFFASDDFVYLLAKRERFMALTERYDKILFCCDIHVAGAVSACSSFTAAAVCVTDKGTTKTKDIFAVAQELSDTIMTKHGVVYAGKM